MKSFLSDKKAQSSAIAFFISAMIAVVFALQVTWPIIEWTLNEQSTTSTPQLTPIPTPVPTQSPEEIAKAKEMADGIWNAFLGITVAVVIIILLLTIYTNIETIIFFLAISISWLIGDKTIKQRVQRIQDIRAWKRNKPQKEVV